MVKIGKTLSNVQSLRSGVPQGGILSPIIYTIYCADLEEWVKYSSMTNYADDTSSSCSGESEEIVMKNLERDATNILQFMASNGLVANTTKTEFMLRNAEREEEERTVKVGSSTITQTRSAKLLGVMMDDDQKWASHFWGKNGLIPSLNKRLYMIRRVAIHVPVKHMKKMVESMWMSKLRYGLQLCTRVRTREDDKKTENMKMTQIVQNKMLRMLDNSKIKDKRSIKEMLEKFDLLSVNQTAAQIKLSEAWKASKDSSYPVKMRDEHSKQDREVRPGTRREMMEGGRLKIIQDSFARDAGKIWNQAPQSIKKAETLIKAKKEIRTYCKLLPV